MALEPNPSMATKIGDRAKTPSVPVASKSELDEHRRLPQVRARLSRVRNLIELRAQQKV